jgi:hypothetical protein
VKFGASSLMRSGMSVLPLAFFSLAAFYPSRWRLPIHSQAPRTTATFPGGRRIVADGGG